MEEVWGSVLRFYLVRKRANLFRPLELQEAVTAARSFVTHRV